MDGNGYVSLGLTISSLFHRLFYLYHTSSRPYRLFNLHYFRFDIYIIYCNVVSCIFPYIYLRLLTLNGTDYSIDVWNVVVVMMDMVAVL